MNDLKEYVLKWLDDNEHQMDDEDSCFYSLCRDVKAHPQFASTSTAALRKLYDAEKGES